MKKIEAVIRHNKLEAVKDALHLKGVQGMTVTEARGFGRQKGHIGTYRGNEYRVDFRPKVKIEVVILDTQAPVVLEAIVRTARSGQIGDGMVFIMDLEQVIRIRTAEVDDMAV
jgi:nitrogen regulatory protein P-II 1